MFEAVKLPSVHCPKPWQPLTPPAHLGAITVPKDPAIIEAGQVVYSLRSPDLSFEFFFPGNRTEIRTRVRFSEIRRSADQSVQVDAAVHSGGGRQKVGCQSKRQYFGNSREDGQRADRRQRQEICPAVRKRLTSSSATAEKRNALIDRPGSLDSWNPSDFCFPSTERVRLLRRSAGALRNATARTSFLMDGRHVGMCAHGQS